MRQPSAAEDVEAEGVMPASACGATMAQRTSGLAAQIGMGYTAVEGGIEG